MRRSPNISLSMLANFVARDIRESYAGTFGGAFWALLQPLFLIVIYWWVFGYVWALKVPLLATPGLEVPFIVFLLSGLLPWLAFQDAIGKSVASVMQRAEVLRQGRFPVAVFPIARVLAAHLVFLLFLLAYALSVRWPDSGNSLILIGGVLFLFGLQLLFAAGVSLVLSSLAVYVKDLPHLVPMALMGLFFTAPILFPMSRIPESLAGWVWLNPYVPFVVGNQALLLEGRWPGMEVWAYAALLACVMPVIGIWVFRKLRPGFADVV